MVARMEEIKTEIRKHNEEQVEQVSSRLHASIIVFDQETMAGGAF